MTARLAVVVTARSSRDQIAGWRGDELWLKVTAAPAGGRANAAACSLVAGSLGIPKSAVQVRRGHTSRHKLLALDGVSEASLRDTFGQPEP
jgi:uncharacterized protein YggU (UPF0235/DUF167 family)